MSRRAKVALASLVEDFQLYPRGTVNAGHVRDLRRSLEAGHADKIPAIVVEAGTLRIVDGFHRRRAYTQHWGADHKVTVELRTYETELELYQDAAVLNATHGQPLDRDDQVRVAVRMRELGAQDEQIALTLHVTQPRVEELLVHYTAQSTGGETVVLKHSARHLAGQTLTLEQEQVQPHITGTATLRLVRDLRERLRYHVVDLSNPKVRDALAELVKEVDEALQQFKAAAG